MIYSLFIVALIAFISCSSFVSGKATGSPICRATVLSDASPMGGTDGSNDGFTFSADSTTYTAGQTITFTINHSDNTKTFKGLLAFVEKPDATNSNINQVGTFSSKSGTTFTGNFASACNDKKTAITQDSAVAKNVPYTLTWTAPAAGTGNIKARVALVTTGVNFQFLSVDLTESATTTTTPAPGASTTATTAAPGATTTPKPNSAQQSGPVMMIIATMMALVMKVVF